MFSKRVWARPAAQPPGAGSYGTEERVINDPKLVVPAAAQAQKASVFILGRRFEAKEESGE